MSATPIPRSLALTRYGDLDVSTLTERPAGRQPVTTVIRAESKREQVLEFVRRETDAGRQAYIVYPVIEESEKTDLKAATTMFQSLSEGIFAGKRVALLHGRMPSAERDTTMRAFRDGAIDVLVATTVIEVGIDVANATVMLIEHPERFGLSQLHQLRGRVGRGAEASYCILLGDTGDDAAERLQNLCVHRRRVRDREGRSANPRHGNLFGQEQSGAEGSRSRIPSGTSSSSRSARHRRENSRSRSGARTERARRHPRRARFAVFARIAALSRRLASGSGSRASS